MNSEVSTVSRRFGLVLSIISTIIGIAVFASVHIALDSIEMGVIVGVVTVIVVFVICYVDVRYQFHKVILWPIRRGLLFALASIVIDRWNVEVRIDSEGNASIVNEFWGKVNFGFNRWVIYGFRADGKQRKDPHFPIEITNMDTDEPVEPEFIIDEPTYKRLKIKFGQELARKAKFHYKIKYTLLKTFFFEQEDYYSHQATHHERQIYLDVYFPSDVIVSDVRGEIETEHGDVWRKHEIPVRVSDRHVTWEIKKAVDGNIHRLKWRTRSRKRAVNEKLI